MTLVTQNSGDTANLFGCDLPCFAIEGWTGNTFLTPCSACESIADSTAYETDHAWDGVFRPVIPVVVNEKNVWDGCTYGFKRNGGGYKAGIHNGKILTEPGPGDGGSLTIGPSGSLIVIRCRDSGGAAHTIWMGTSESKYPDELPFERAEASCSPGPGSITLKKISGLPCICEEAGPPLICPEAADCDCDNPVIDCARNPIYCFRIFISGFDADTSCNHLNGEQFAYDNNGSGCTYTFRSPVPNPVAGVSKVGTEGLIQCVDDLADGTGFWEFRDGNTSAARGRISSANEDSACPPHSATFPVEGLCDCNGQFGTATLSYGQCPCIGTNEGPCPDVYPCP